ncbi:kinase-like domain-containing protein [Chaetomium fimeti]|uniref:Kinase-like domain-containing protein n=1 Tax=Chaetomium fimeti TaxID=1854472 RepID=A0AAE0HLI9_9PEZI|nr:kinase-like domain-containing protein [Chaetomium fimeti]
MVSYSSRIPLWSLLPGDHIVPAEARASTIGHAADEFPTMTDDQYRRLKNDFIESLDPNAVCALASKHNRGRPCRVVAKASGSFNVCFFVEFDGKGPEWAVRIPIEPAFELLENAWIKVQSEVATMRYLQKETRIPVPCVFAYGRDVCLTKSRTRTQMFIISGFVHGHALNKSLLVGAEEQARKRFYSQLIDVLTELRGLEFPVMGSLMPDADRGSCPHVGPVISMSATTLLQPHHSAAGHPSFQRPPRKPFASASEYMKYQLSLISGFLLLPVADHTIDDIKEEMFAFRGIEQISQDIFTSQLDGGPFVLHHLDLRSANIIVDGEFNIKAIIDWEFSGTIPRRLFTPPSWITGHDATETDEQIQMHTDFRAVLDEKSKAHARCRRLREEWYDERTTAEANKAFYLAHVLRRPTDVTDVFSAFVAQQHPNKPFDELVSHFFHHNQALTLEAHRRADQCERYTQHLKDNGLYETDLDRLLARSEAFKATWR